MQGFLNLLKPAGITSHDAVAQVRRLLHLKRIGHGGTLDPAATGVLPMAIGRATRFLQFLPTDKVYQATIQLGVKTTTDDLEGEVIYTQPVDQLSREQIISALQHFTGKIQQVPPQYSAIQVKGKRLYDLARRGEQVEVPARMVEVYRIDVLDWRSGDFPQVDVEIACGSGTYIRAIARDLGKILQTGGTLAALKRTQSSGMQLVGSLSLEELAAQIQQGKFQPISPAIVLQHLGVVNLDLTTAQKWCQGQRVRWDDTTTTLLNNSPLRVHATGDRFLGIGFLVNINAEQFLIPQLVFEQY